jgi:dihydrofolate synthase/folylpolyglutamate synthase
LRPNLDSLERLGWRFGLQTTEILLAELGNPQRGLSIVHVAGTNGKGSTCAFMASLLKSCGYKTGLYTSPHLCDIRERFRINGTWISSPDFHRHEAQVLSACERVRRKLGHLPTHFEALTAIAFCWFQEQGVDWLVLEVGLGGRFDATNVITVPEVALITPVGLEHQEILGKTLGRIAGEKAGILKPLGLAATIQTHREALGAIQQTARERGVRLWVGGRDFKYRLTGNKLHWEGQGLNQTFRLPEPHLFQALNASLAIAGLQLLISRGVHVSVHGFQAGLSHMFWPGRMEVLKTQPLVLLDGAHNPDAAKALSASLKREYPGEKMILLNGFLRDKDYGTCAKILAPHAALGVVTKAPSDRAEEGLNIVKAWERAGVRTLWIRHWKQALEVSSYLAERARKPLLIMGSLYLGGACRKGLTGLKGLHRI